MTAARSHEPSCPNHVLERRVSFFEEPIDVDRIHHFFHCGGIGDACFLALPSKPEVHFDQDVDS